MTVDTDWYPTALDKRVDFHINLDNEAGNFKSKYGWDGAVLASIHADRLWMEYWYNRKLEIDLKEKQMTGYIKIISGNKDNPEAPEPPDFTAASAPPAEVPPGIEKRTRELRRETVNKGVYSKADGLALGFERAASTKKDLSEIAPEIILKTLANYQLSAEFSKQGMDAARFKYRYKGGNWTPITDAPSSPAILTVPAQMPGEAAQIEIRAIFLRKYQTIGKYSPNYSAVIAP